MAECQNHSIYETDASCTSVTLFIAVAEIGRSPPTSAGSSGRNARLHNAPIVTEKVFRRAPDDEAAFRRCAIWEGGRSSALTGTGPTSSWLSGSHAVLPPPIGTTEFPPNARADRQPEASGPIRALQSWQSRSARRCGCVCQRYLSPSSRDCAILSARARITKPVQDSRGARRVDQATLDASRSSTSRSRRLRPAGAMIKVEHYDHLKSAKAGGEQPPIIRSRSVAEGAAASLALSRDRAAGSGRTSTKISSGSREAALSPPSLRDSPHPLD